MKKVMFLVVMIVAVNNIFAQKADSTAADKSSTISALCDAQEEVIAEILNDLYESDGKIDVIKAYATKIKPRIAECLETDMIATGLKIKENALEGKFKKIKIRFEKPEDNKFRISGATKRSYKRAYKKFKKEFPETRKGKTLTTIFSEKEMNKKIDKVAKVMTKEFKKNVRKVSR